MLGLDAVSLRYGPAQVLDAVTFDVAAGEIVGLLGPNGAGKSSSLRALLGLVAPHDGTARRPDRVGYLPEDHVGYEALSVGAYLTYLARLRAISRHERAAAVTSALEPVEATDLIRRPMGRLSHGQRQRVGLAQAWLGDPEALVLDEPTTGLDPGQVDALRRELRARADAGAAVLVSTHLLAEVASSCDRVVVLARGRVVADETVDADTDLAERFRTVVAEAELS